MQEMGLEDEDKVTSHHTRVYIGKTFLINDGQYCTSCTCLGSRGENQMEKRLTSIRPLTKQKGKTKFCALCGSIATQEALFEVEGGVTLIEKYCDICIKKIK